MMDRLHSILDPASDAFQANREHHLALVEELRRKLAMAALGGSERSRERHLSLGKLLPRDRVAGVRQLRGRSPA